MNQKKERILWSRKNKPINWPNIKIGYSGTTQIYYYYVINTPNKHALTKNQTHNTQREIERERKYILPDAYHGLNVYKCLLFLRRERNI